MSQAKSGDTVKVHYKGTLEDGSEFDSSAEQDPIEVTIGDGLVIPGFEKALIGMAPGETKTVTLPAEEAYGPHVADNVHEIERSRIPPEIDLEVGIVLHASGPSGETVRMTVTGLTDSTVTLDANHPLAGRALTFELELVSIG